VSTTRGASTTSYRYDPLGRRCEKRTGERRVLFVWDGDVLSGEIEVDAAGAVRTREWVYRPDSFEPLALLDDSREQGAPILYYHNDINGCPTRLTDGAGETRWAASHTAWGGIARLHSNDTSHQPLRLQGQYADAETGLHYNRYRYFDPGSGMFVSKDPIGLHGGANVYRFAPNSLQWIDPWGLKCKFFAKNPKEAHAAIREQWGHAMSAADMRELRDAIDRIKRRQQRYVQDGTPFENSHLIDPTSQRLNTGNTYQEWTVRTPNVGNRADRRIVVNEQTGQAFYSHDHYRSFIELDLNGW
jgi:RHS repeat-associated protein